MKIFLIAAISCNNAIGKNNTLPWHLSNDLKIFKQLTTNHAVIMGRKTFDSIGKPLPNRLNIVLTQNNSYSNNMPQNMAIAHSLSSAIEIARPLEKIFIIGGQKVFNEGILIADTLYITKVNTLVSQADAFFPEINKNIWKVSSQIDYKADAKNDFDHSFCTYERI
ncbi:MAG: dihydrofolate reductase [Solitalea-like symbiont of Acarus siro]